MNFEFIEGRETRDKVVKFGGVGIADEEIVNNKGKRGGVGVVAEKHGGGGFGVAVLGKEGDKSKLGQETRLWEARDSLKNITEEEGFAVGVTEERKETKFYEGGGGRWKTHQCGQTQEREEWHQGSNRQCRWWP